MDAEVPRGGASAFGLSGFEQKQHVQAALDLGVAFLADESFERFDRFGDLGEVVHSRASFL